MTKKNKIIIFLVCIAITGAVVWVIQSGKQPVTGDQASSASSVSKEDIQITPENTMQLITLRTSKGDIIFKTYTVDAPKTVENFISLAKKGFYDSLIFHRVIKGFMIQGGDPKGDGTGGPGYMFDDELNPATESYKQAYKKGVVAMANAGPNTNGSQFFIMLEDYPLPNDYTIFGRVIQGQEVVDEIGMVATDSSDRPKVPVAIEKVIVAEERDSSLRSE